MFRHVVLLKFSDAADDAHRARIVEELRTLPGLIPEISAYTVGEDAAVNEGNHDIVVVADFVDVDAYLVYRDHVEHQRVIHELIVPVLASRAAVQHHVAD
jgi:hypothetical protein